MPQNEHLLTLQKYRKVALLLGNEEDARHFDEIISMYREYRHDNAQKTTASPRKKSDESMFNEFVQNQGAGLEELPVHQDIKANKERIMDFWDSLTEDRKKEFTIFDLNIIRFLVSEHFDKYSPRDKQKVIASVESVIRAKKKDYRNIKV